MSEAVAIRRVLEPAEKKAAEARMKTGKPGGKLPQGKARDKVARLTGVASAPAIGFSVFLAAWVWGDGILTEYLLLFYVILGMNTVQAVRRCLSRAEELRDQTTYIHELRVSSSVNLVVNLLGRELGLANDDIGFIARAATLHDIGKFSVPIEIIQKTTSLSREEFALMKKHTIHGFEILTGTDDRFLNLAAEVARHHHERFDGVGYPDELNGEEIELPSRIIAICDVYDALRQNRPYRPSFHHADAMSIIIAGDERTPAGQFDPVVLSSFEKIEHSVERLYQFDFEGYGSVSV